MNESTQHGLQFLFVAALCQEPKSGPVDQSNCLAARSCPFNSLIWHKSAIYRYKVNAKVVTVCTDECFNIFGARPAAFMLVSEGSIHR